MFRLLTLAVMLALAAPTLASAQQPPGHGQNKGRAAPPPGRPAFVPHGPVGGPARTGRPAFVPGGPGLHGPVVGSPFHPGAGAAQFSYRGHFINRIRLSPFIYPPGWAYREWAVGAMLPPLFLAPTYYYPEWAALGLEPPPPGCQWVRYGPDLLLVNVATGQVLDVAYGVFY